MSDANVNQLLIALLALLPKDGTPMTVNALAKAAGVGPRAVTEALFGEWRAGRLHFDVRTDTYTAQKQGDHL